MVMGSELPRVVVYQVVTADGRVALSPDRLLMDDPRWPRYDSGGYHEVFRLHQPQVILEGAGTMVLPDAAPLKSASNVSSTTTVGTAGQADGPVGLGPIRSPHFLPDDVLAKTTTWFAAVDSRGRVRWPFTNPFPGRTGLHLIVLVSESTPGHYLDYLRSESIPYLVAGLDRVDLRQALTLLHSELGASTVVATCGAILSGALLRAGLIDELNIEILPILAGGRHTPTMMASADLPADEPPTALRLMSCSDLDGGRMLLRYAVERHR